MVFSGLVTAWRLAPWPTRRSPSSVKATIEGVVRMPSAFSMTFGVLPSMTATHALVVPRSMPMTLPMVLPLKLRQAGRASKRPSEDVSGSSADPRSSPLDTRFAAFSRLTGSYRRGAPRPARQPVTKSRVAGHNVYSMVIGPLPHRVRPVRQASRPAYLESPRACSVDFLFTYSWLGPEWQLLPPPRAPSRSFHRAYGSASSPRGT